jgi:hypothetical protein
MNRQQKDWRSDFMDLLSTSNVYDHTNAKQRKFMTDFISTLLEKTQKDMEESEALLQQAVAEENKAWFLGKRCRECGGEMPQFRLGDGTN